MEQLEDDEIDENHGLKVDSDDYGQEEEEDNY